VALFGASAAQVGWVLAVYNASGFVASLALPTYADRRHDYLRPLVACGVLTLALAGLLASAVISVSGNRAVLLVIAAVAILNVATTTALLRTSVRGSDEAAPRGTSGVGGAPMSRAGVVGVVVAFVLLQATNSAAVSVMNLFVTRALRLDVGWAGAALGLSAALEIPALLLIGRLGHRVSDIRIIAAGSLLGIAYYAGMAYASGLVALLALQVLGAGFFAVVVGVGLSLFQRVIPRPGLASGLYTNTRRTGAVVSGPVTRDQPRLRVTDRTSSGPHQPMCSGHIMSLGPEPDRVRTQLGVRRRRSG
jgi:SET family sugar efflux transporter-like MFS transporter